MRSYVCFNISKRHMIAIDYGGKSLTAISKFKDTKGNLKKSSQIKSVTYLPECSMINIS